MGPDLLFANTPNSSNIDPEAKYFAEKKWLLQGRRDPQRLKPTSISWQLRARLEVVREKPRSSHLTQQPSGVQNEEP